MNQGSNLSLRRHLTNPRRLLLAAPLVAVVGLLAYGIFAREHQLNVLTSLAAEQSIPAVEIIAPQAGPPTRALVLPGTIHAWSQAPIFAQVSGYVQSWVKDYGATVKAGDLLATIATPTLDAQFAAARANLAVAEANYRIAVSTAARWKALEGTPAVATQQVDVQIAAAAARNAELVAARENVQRYAALESFKRIVAPFDGVVTERLTDVGDYVNAAGGEASARSGATQLFTIADIHAMRVFVAVPEDYASALVPGLTATLYQPSQPDIPVRARYLTTARAFTINTRTSQTELTVDNPDGKLWPGTYVDVHLQVPSDPAVLIIPEQALIFNAGGTQVAVVGADDRVHLRRVTLGYNLGQLVQVTGGILARDRLVNNPPAGLLEGEIVKPVTPIRGYSRTSGP